MNRLVWFTLIMAVQTGNWNILLGTIAIANNMIPSYSLEFE